MRLACRHWSVVVVAAGLMAMLLASCGGGGSSANKATSTSQTTQLGNMSVTTTSPLQPAVTSGGSGSEVTGVAGALITNLQLTGLQPTPVNAAAALKTTKIAFTRNNQLMLMNADGTGQVQVSPGADASSPHWFPDGVRLAFIKLDTSVGLPQVYTINADGSDLQRLSDGTKTCDSPSVSRDGTKIAFAQHAANTTTTELYTMPATGGTATQITSGNDDNNPTWSPDGSRIAFRRFPPASVGAFIFVADANGANVHKLLTDDFGANALAPSWSPIGNFVVFSLASVIAYAPAGDVPTANVTMVTGSGVAGDLPDWSPDGSRIVFVEQQVVPAMMAGTKAGGVTPTVMAQLWAIDPSGGSPVQLTATQANINDNSPAWSPLLTYSNLVGTDGIMGTEAAGFIVGQRGTVVTSVLTFDAAVPANASITTTTGISPGLTSYLFSIVAPEGLTSLVYLNDLYSYPFVIIDASTTPASNAALVSYDAVTGLVAAVMPYASETTYALTRARKPTISRSGNTVIVQGAFASVWDAGGVNRAPRGATEVRLDAASGKLLMVK